MTVTRRTMFTRLMIDWAAVVNPPVRTRKKTELWVIFRFDYIRYRISD